MRPGISRALGVFTYIASASLTFYYFASNTPIGGLKGLQTHVYYQDRSVNWPAIEADITRIWHSVANNELALFIVLNLVYSLYTLASLVTTWTFLGHLSPRESARVTERMVKHIVLKTVFAGAVLQPDMMLELAAWMIWFAAVGFTRVFTGAAKDRLEALVALPSATSTQHIRALSLLVLMQGHNLLALRMLLGMLSQPVSTTKLLLSCFDATVLIIDGAKSLVRYAIHMLERRAHGNSLTSGEDAAHTNTSGWSLWGGTGSVLYHVELLSDLTIHILTLAHYLHVWYLHGLSFHVSMLREALRALRGGGGSSGASALAASSVLHTAHSVLGQAVHMVKESLVDAVLLLDIRGVAVALHRRVSGHLMYRTATQKLDHAFPDHTPPPEESCECTICMDAVTCGKQLPCGHAFHLSCLRAWLQQSGIGNFTCPNCRTPILVGPPGSEGRRPRQGVLGAMENAIDQVVLLVDPFVTALVIRFGRTIGALPPGPAPPREGMGESPDVPAAAEHDPRVTSSLHRSPARPPAARRQLKARRKDASTAVADIEYDNEDFLPAHMHVAAVGRQGGAGAVVAAIGRALHSQGQVQGQRAAGGHADHAAGAGGAAGAGAFHASGHAAGASRYHHRPGSRHSVSQGRGSTHGAELQPLGHEHGQAGQVDEQDQEYEWLHDSYGQPVRVPVWVLRAAGAVDGGTGAAEAAGPSRAASGMAAGSGSAAGGDGDAGEGPSSRLRSRARHDASGSGTAIAACDGGVLGSLMRLRVIYEAAESMQQQPSDCADPAGGARPWHRGNALAGPAGPSSRHHHQHNHNHLQQQQRVDGMHLHGEDASNASQDAPGIDLLETWDRPMYATYLLHGGRLRLLHLPMPGDAGACAGDIPSWSGQAAVRGLQSIAAAASSLHTALARAGPCPGAVAGGGSCSSDEGEQEVDSTWRPPRSSARAPSHAQGPAAAAARRARQARRSQRQAVAAERREQGGPERQFSDSPSPSGDDDDLGEEAEPSGSGLSEDERRGENRRQGRRAGSLLYRLVQRVQSWLAVAVAWSGWQLRLAGRGQGDRGADLAGRHNTHTQGQLQLQQQRRRGGWLQWCARVAGSIGRGFAAAWPSVMAVWSVLMGALAGLLAVMALDLARAHMSWGGTPTPIPIDAPPIQHTPAGGQ